jgi:hypothetical protein
MIRKSGYRFSDQIMLRTKELRRDHKLASSAQNLALGAAMPQ